jgi:hypothetical protein
MEASCSTQLKCEGQDKRDTVACDVAYSVQVAKDVFKGVLRSGYMLIDLISYKMVENLTKMADQLLRYQALLVLEKAASPPTTAVSHNSLSGSWLTGLMW